MTEIVAKTERLILRTWKSDDREEFARHLNTPAVTRHLGGVQNAEQLDAAFARIDGYQRDQGHTFWAIERTIDSAFLGFCGLKVADVPGTPVDGEVEIGWRLRVDAWGKGYAREAAEAALDWGWRNLSRPRIVAFTIPLNAASRKLMERLGFRHHPELDFNHPRFAADHPLSRHITYVAERPRP